MIQSTWILRARIVVAVLALIIACSADSVAGDEATDESPVKEIKMTVENWKWTPRVIRVPVGTRVKLTIMSYDATHRFDLKKLGLKENLPEGATTSVEFVADKVGTFRWKCGRPCGNGCPKMTGELIVEEPGAESGEGG